MPGPGQEHALLQSRLITTLGVFLIAHQLGELLGTGCFNLPLPDTTEELLCPDLSYTLPARQVTMPLRGSYLVGAPDLVIEIASPHDTRPELAEKAQTYLLAGVRMVWIVWPRSQTIDVWRNDTVGQPWQTWAATDQIDGLDLIPGFTYPVSDLFR